MDFKIYYGAVKTVRMGLIDVRGAHLKTFDSYNDACSFEDELTDKNINFVNANEYTGDLLVK